MPKTEPDYLDIVRHVTSGESGTVLFAYTINDVKYLDVDVCGRMIYQTPASKWEVVTRYIQ